MKAEMAEGDVGFLLVKVLSPSQPPFCKSGQVTNGRNVGLSVCSW